MLLILQLGPSALAGFAVFLLVIPIQGYAMRLLLQMRRRSMKFTDRRAGLLQEYVEDELFLLPNTDTEFA